MPNEMRKRGGLHRVQWVYVLLLLLLFSSVLYQLYFRFWQRRRRRRWIFRVCHYCCSVRFSFWFRNKTLYLTKPISHRFIIAVLIFAPFARSRAYKFSYLLFCRCAAAVVVAYTSIFTVPYEYGCKKKICETVQHTFDVARYGSSSSFIDIPFLALFALK